ncbi:MAG: hypothetical protein SFU83_05360 [Meiothermus sp.]|nr:hypothetical protein [Meiothermus sp.]
MFFHRRIKVGLRVAPGRSSTGLEAQEKTAPKGGLFGVDDGI